MAKKGSIYELNGRVELKRAIPLGIQHVLAMFLGNISPLIIVCGLLNIDSNLRSMLIQNAMFIAGLITLVQLYPIGPVGAKLPIVMGTSSGFIGTAQAIGLQYGYGAIIGAGLVGGIMEAILGFFIKPLKKLFPPIVTSLVIISIGLSLLPVGIKYFGGGAGAKDFGSLNHLLVGTTVIIVILVLKQFKGFLNDSSIFIGIIVGYILAICLGMVDFTQVKEASIFVLPQIHIAKPSLNAILTILPATFVVVAEHVGHLVVTSSIVGKDLSKDPGLNRSLLGDGLSTMISGFFGSVPTTTYGENIGVMALTKVYSSYVICGAGVLSVILGFSGSLSALIRSIPTPVIGGVSLLLFGTIATSGLRTFIEEKVDYSKSKNLILTSVTMIVGLSNIAVRFGAIEIKGMGLATIVAMILSISFMIFDKLGLMNEK